MHCNDGIGKNVLYHKSIIRNYSRDITASSRIPFKWWRSQVISPQGQVGTCPVSTSIIIRFLHDPYNSAEPHWSKGFEKGVQWGQKRTQWLLQKL